MSGLSFEEVLVNPFEFTTGLRNKMNADALLPFEMSWSSHERT